MEIVVLVIISAFILFLVIVNAVKIAVKEALHEFKEEIMNEFKLDDYKRTNDENKSTN